MAGFPADAFFRTTGGPLTLLGDAAASGGRRRRQGVCPVPAAVHPRLFKESRKRHCASRVLCAKSKAALFMRNRVMNLLRVPWVADFNIAGEITDKLTLPQY